MSVELFKVKNRAKTRKVFKSDSLTLGHGKPQKVIEIVIESPRIKLVKRVLTLGLDSILLAKRQRSNLTWRQVIDKHKIIPS